MTPDLPTTHTVADLIAADAAWRACDHPDKPSRPLERQEADGKWYRRHRWVGWEHLPPDTLVHGWRVLPLPEGKPPTKRVPLHRLMGHTLADGYKAGRIGQLRDGEFETEHAVLGWIGLEVDDDGFVEVQIDPKPETHKVKWWEAKGEYAPDGRRIIAVCHDDEMDGPYCQLSPTTALGHGDNLYADASGFVEVLVEAPKAAD